MSNVKSVEAGNFESEVVQATEPVIVDFWAPWCSPCRMLSPLLDRAAEKYSGEVKFVKCDIDDNPALATQFGVMTIPNLIFFKNGQVVDQAVGYVSEAQLSDKVQRVLGS